MLLTALDPPPTDHVGVLRLVRQEPAQPGGQLGQPAHQDGADRGGGGQRQQAHHGTHPRSEEHTSELQSRVDLVCRLLLEKKKEKQVMNLLLKKKKKKKKI